VRIRGFYVPESDATVCVEVRVSMHLLHSDGHCAGTRVTTEVVTEMPRRQQTHLEHSSIVRSTGSSRRDQQQSG